MLLEIKKEKNKYILLNPPKKAGTHFYIDTANGKLIPGKRAKKAPAGNIYKTLEQLAKKYPGNEFLNLSLQLTPKNYSACEPLSNNNLLNEAWSEKYGI
jgi:glucose dehydrogenase